MSDAEARPAASRPAAPPPADLRRDELPLTVIHPGDIVVGRLDLAGNVQVLGRVEGELRCAGDLLVTAEGRVQAGVRCRNLTIAGVVQGDVIARGRLKITGTGRLEGDAVASSLSVQEGGVHRGGLHVYPDGVPETLLEEPSAPEPAPEQAPSPRPAAGSMERVKKMWGELF